jgi:cytochrome c
MDSFELNKIVGAILGTLLFVMGTGFLAEAIYSPIEGRGPGYPLPEPEATQVADEAPAAEPALPMGLRLASASVERGATAVRRCQACHNFEAGAGHKQGPELYDLVENLVAHHEDFAYSDILAQYRAEGMVWSFENLDTFLLAPRDFAPGTKMNFAGVRSDVERADILAYMASLSPTPTPFPPAEEPVATDAEAIDTPTVTQTETQVEGTPLSGAPTGEGIAPLGDDADPEQAEPAEDAPALRPPVAEETQPAPAQ